MFDCILNSGRFRGSVSPLALVLALVVSACAQSPSAIPPVSMAGAYDDISCDRARQMLAAERTTLASLSAAQQGAVTGDAVGVLLIGVPMSSLSGGDKAGEIGLSKGKIAAFEAKLSTCPA
jgi:hypothetical protein